MKTINSIFIIDDDPIMVFGMRKMLDSVIQYKTLYTYVNGKSAIEGIKQIIEKNEEIPQVIFLDINMPIMDGWQFLEEFITLPITTKVRVNIITSSIDSQDELLWKSIREKTHHMITYNNKPIRKQEVEAITKVA